MNGSILVAYASAHGSTRQVAEAIGRRLVDRGLDVDLAPAGEVDDLGPYDGVVLGAALYAGRLHRDARRFLRRHHEELARRRFAVFAMGPATMSEHDVAGSWKQLDAGLAKARDVRSVTTAIFGGVVDPAQLRFPFNRMPASDARDWQAIERWADEVAAALGATELAGASA